MLNESHAYTLDIVKRSYGPLTGNTLDTLYRSLESFLAARGKPKSNLDSSSSEIYFEVGNCNKDKNFTRAIHIPTGYYVELLETGNKSLLVTGKLYSKETDATTKFW